MGAAVVHHDVGRHELLLGVARGDGQVDGDVVGRGRDGRPAVQRQGGADQAARHPGGAQRVVAVVDALVAVRVGQLGQRGDLQRDVGPLRDRDVGRRDVLQVDALVPGAQRQPLLGVGRAAA